MVKAPLKNDISTTLGKRTRFTGRLGFKNSLKIDGYFSGSIVSDGFLYVEEGARVEADISVGGMVIGGTVIGNIEVRDRVEFLPTGKLKGNVRSPEIKIADGVEYSGKCEMLQNPDDVDIFSASVDQLKKTVQRSAKK
ncbi:MAG: polymer-forming cytoskeletal protein [Spirochaetales bacterium]|nr:polymer-forming cytoskeletal protein [Spirochaetales bacterium]